MALQCVDYVLWGKRKKGDPHMSDRVFGNGLGRGFSPSAISDARYGYMRDAVAIELEDLLRSEGVAPGEILLTARVERENNQVVKERLLNLAKTLASVPKRAAAAVFGAVVALGLLGLPQPANAGSGGVERSRRRHRY